MDMYLPSPTKCYTISRQWQSGRDLQIKYLRKAVLWAVFHTSRFGSDSAVIIHEKTMGGPIVSTGTLDSISGFSFRLASKRPTICPVQYWEGPTVYDCQYQFQLPETATLAWKEARKGEFTILPNSPQTEKAEETKQGDWLLVHVRGHIQQFDQQNERGSVAAVYTASRGISGRARIYYMEELGQDTELGALTTIISLVRWEFNKAKRTA